MRSESSRIRRNSRQQRSNPLGSFRRQPIALARLPCASGLADLDRELWFLADKLRERLRDVLQSVSELLELSVDRLRINVRLPLANLEPVSDSHYPLSG